MSDETTEPQGESTTAEGGAVEPAATAAPATTGPSPAELALARRREERMSRLVLPLLIPIGAILSIGFVVLNVSRVFLASSKDDTTPAVLIATGLTIAILVGATIVSASSRIRSSPLVLTVGLVMLLVLLSGSVVLGASEPEKKASTGYKEPTGPSVNTLDVTALPTLKFDKTSYTAPAGVNTINYIDGGGTHTFVFEKAYPGFELQVPPSEKKKIELTPGTYTFYCTIPGHRAAGMEATLTVTAAAPAAGQETTSTSAGSPEAGGGSTTTTAPAGTTTTGG
jgi:plastocyanin